MKVAVERYDNEKMASAMEPGDWAIVVESDSAASEQGYYAGVVLYRTSATDRDGNDIWIIFGGDYRNHNEAGDYGDRHWARRIKVRPIHPGDVVKITV